MSTLLLKKQQLLPADFMAADLQCFDSFDFGCEAMDIDSDTEFLADLFPVNDTAEDLLEATEDQLTQRIVKDCVDDIVDSVVPAPLSRSNSLKPISRSNSLVALTHKSIDTILDDPVGPADPSVFDTETEVDESSEDEGDETDYEAELYVAQDKIQKLEKEVASLRNQLKRSRDTYESSDCYETPERPVKRVKTGIDRHGCPYCEFEKHSGCEKRAIKEHMTNGSCPVASHDMLNTPCKYSTAWCQQGDSGFSVIKSMGFDDPYHFVESFRFYKCPGCNFRHNNSAKMVRHMVSKKCIHISKAEASAIVKEQLEAKKSGNLIF